MMRLTQSHVLCIGLYQATTKHLMNHFRIKAHQGLSMRIKSRYPEVVEYSAETVWDGETGGIVLVGGGKEVSFDTPQSYGGRGQGICPDELFVSAVLGCLNNTFLDFQRRYELVLVSLRLQGRATSRFDGQGYRITGIRVSGQVTVGQGDLDAGRRCVDLMKEYCHLSRSLKECIPVEYDIKVTEGEALGRNG